MGDGTPATTAALHEERSGLLVSHNDGNPSAETGLGDQSGGPWQIVFVGARTGVVVGCSPKGPWRTAIWHTDDGGTSWTADVPSIT
jgi:photosystem II stability/assembly factor-like uncharacterized protein